MRKKVLTLALILLVILLIILLTFVVYEMIKSKENKEGIENILSQVEMKNARITEYIVYGTHLNLKGEIEEVFTNIKDINLLMAGIDGKEQKIKLRI